MKVRLMEQPSGLPKGRTSTSYQFYNNLKWIVAPEASVGREHTDKADPNYQDIFFR
jgi:hypothetical protein